MSRLDSIGLAGTFLVLALAVEQRFGPDHVDVTVDSGLILLNPIKRMNRRRLETAIANRNGRR